MKANKTTRLLLLGTLSLISCHAVWVSPMPEKRVYISTEPGRKTFSKMLGDSIGKPQFLANPSFEGLAGTPGFLPFGWDNLGENGETPADTQPNCFGVTQKPAHGSSFLGMVDRSNGTTEAVGQWLERPLEMGCVYQTSLDLCRSEKYESITRIDPQNVISYTKPVKVRVWSYIERTKKSELLAETPPIKNTDWQTFNLVFKPTQPCAYLYFEAFFTTPEGVFYDGNVLVDNAGPIQEIIQKVESKN